MTFIENKIDISFCIPCYNVSKYIAACVASIEAQNLSDHGISYDIMLINDCSTDDTLEMLKKLAAGNAHCKVVDFEQNRGISAVRNHAILNAQGEYIWFVDGDDLLFPKSASCMYKTAKKYNADKCFGDYYETTTPDELPAINYDNIAIHYGKNLILPSLNQNKAVAGSVSLGVWKRDFLIRNDLFFDETVGMEEDVLFNFLSEYSDRIFVKIDVPCYVYRVGHSSATTAKSLSASINNYQSCKRRFLIFCSYLTRDHSEKLKKRIDVQYNNMIRGLLNIQDRNFVKTELQVLTTEKLFPYDRFTPPESKLKMMLNNGVKNVIHAVLLDNIRSIVHFWFAYYVLQMFHKNQHQSK